MVTCQNGWSLAQLHSAILKQAGYTIEQSTTRTLAGSNKIAAKFGGRFRAGIAQLGGEASGESVTSEETQVNEVSLELDPSDVNDVITALQEVSFDAYIVLEDFHYLPDETQKQFSGALKAFHESSSYCFIVVGVWLDENRLIQHNGDLTGRVVPVNADAWSRDELLEVIEGGEKLLNVSFPDDFKTELVNGCFESVYVVQEACYRVCAAENIVETLDRPMTVGTGVHAFDVIRDVVAEQSARYNSFLSNFAAGFRETELEMYKWLLLPVLATDPIDLERGIRYADVKRVMQDHHPEGEDLNPGNITQALQFIASLQVKYDIKPIILDYDQSFRILSVVDKGFLIWLKHQNRAEILAAAGLPPIA